jgi:hypothetical protein
MSEPADEMLEWMESEGLDITRENYIAFNWGSDITDWTPEHENELPLSLQDWSLFMADENGELVYTGKLAPDDDEEDDDDSPFGDARRWDEGKVSRGQPDNAGQFGPGGYSAKTKIAKAKARAKAARSSAKRGNKSERKEGAERAVRPKSMLTKMSLLVKAGRTKEAEALLSTATTQRQARVAGEEIARAEKRKSSGKKDAKKGDFDKAKIRISTEGEAAFLKSWNDKIGIDPEVFKHDFLGGVDATMSVRKEGSKFIVNGSVNGTGRNEGRSVGTYTREIDPDRKYAYSAYFELQKGVQHGDIGKKVLAGNVETYEKLGIETVGVSANIDVGGYAWAKYGYVPTPDSWSELRSTLKREINRSGSSSRGSRSRANQEEAEEWDWLSEDTQNEVRDRWMSDSRQEFIDSEVTNWRDSGQALNEAKRDLASTFSDDVDPPEWVNEAIQSAREEHEEGGKKIPFTNQQIYLAMKANEYNSRYDDGRDDIEFEFDDGELKEPKGYDPNQKTLPGIEKIEPHEYLTEDARATIIKHVASDANDRAESEADNVEPPSYLADQVEEYQQEYWDSMSDDDMLRHARTYDLNYYEGAPDEDDEDEDDDEPKQKEMDVGKVQSEDEKLLEILQSNNPKAIWKFADSGERAKKMLLGQSWRGKLNLKDPEAYKRFKDYVGRVKKEEPSGKEA